MTHNNNSSITDLASRLAEMGRSWKRVGLDIRDHALDGVDTGIQATSEALDHDEPVDLRDASQIDGVIARWTDVAGTWADVGVEIGRNALDATAGGLRESKRAFDDDNDD